ncbi:hypothetical protein GWI33_017793 [Rhynchophorus ferrugineus]|uniref:CRAL-TRIO domain-containing protein n=1 Tax=Rhynchophorus ferrugineus TaxID=354439 RepID=A0A834HXV9_RHYFE|nr:hypothetical protein GWI33_017793 [Rhynchophorus ferrugineus]
MICRDTADKYFRPPSAEQVKIILQSINEYDKGKLNHNEELLKQWIKYQKHFPQDIDPAMTRSFLRGTKHNIDQAKRKLENYLAAKQLYPDIYLHRAPILSKEILKAMEVMNVVALPNLTTNGCRINWFSLNIGDPSEFSSDYIMKFIFMFGDLMFMMNQPVAGEIIVIDASLARPEHVIAFFGSVVKKLIILLRNAYPIRLHQVHVIKAPHMVDKFMSLIKPLLHPKIRDKIYFHKDAKSLMTTFGIENLPSDYGGYLKSLRYLALDCYQIIKENITWFERQQHIKLSYIPEKVQTDLNCNEYFGVDGSFRQLNVD